MDEEIDRLVVAVRADVGAFRRDVELMRGALDGPLEAGAERAGRAIEGALARAVRTGRLGAAAGGARRVRLVRGRG